MSKLIGLLLAMALTAAVVPPASAFWVQDGVALSAATGAQVLPAVVSDGSGGAIVVWRDFRSGSVNDIYAQRTSASGVALWTTNGVPICTAAGEQIEIAVVTDGSGGAIVTWSDLRSGNYDIYAQRVDAGGALVPTWQADGVAICTAAGNQQEAVIIPDGAGGAIVTWEDYRSGGAPDIYAQRVDASGAVLWAQDGVPICTTTGYQCDPTIVPDGCGGAIMAWGDVRIVNNSDIYAQRVDASGIVQWIADGVPLCTARSPQSRPHAVSDGAGGAIVAWDDIREYTIDIFAQRVSASGSAEWVADGVAVCIALYSQTMFSIFSDGSGGAIVLWGDDRAGRNQYDIYAQRMSASGSVLWAPDGLVITGPGVQDYGATAPDGSGGVIVVWRDFQDLNLYVQRVSAAGEAQWGAGGAALCTAAGQHWDPEIVSDGSGGAIVAWSDNRNDQSDIYAQSVDALGRPGQITGLPQDDLPAMTVLAGATPNPFNPATVIGFSLAHPGQVRLVVYDAAGRQVRVLANEARPAGRNEARWDGTADDGRQMASGVYFCRMEAGEFRQTKRMTLVR